MPYSVEPTEARAERMRLPYKGCCFQPPPALTACRAFWRQPTLTAPPRACIPPSKRLPRPAPPLPAYAMRHIKHMMSSAN